MASKVNTKFIWGLGAVVVLVFVGVAVVAAGLMKTSPGQLAAKGDKLLAEGKIREASRQYAKAVNKEQTSKDYLNKWRDALGQLAEPKKLAFDEDFEAWRNSTRQLAIVNKDDVALQRQYLELVLAQVRGSTARGPQEYLLRESETILAYHATKGAGPWDALRRYRGAALFTLYALTDLKPEQFTQATKDLDAALAADPGDAEASLWLQSMYLIQAERFRGAGKTDEAAAADAKASELLAKFLEKNPTNGLAMLESIRRDLGVFQREAAGLTKEQVVAKSKALRDAMLPRLDAAAAQVKSMGRSIADNGALGRLRQMEEALDPGARLKRSLDAITAALAASPTDADLMLLRADVLESSEDYAGAIEQTQKILDLPVRAVSVLGQKQWDIKLAARYFRALWAVRAWQVIPDAADKKDAKAAALAAAREYRKDLAANEAPDSIRLMLVDAQLAYVDRDLIKANQLLAQYNRSTKQGDVDALWLQAQVAYMSNNLGVTRQSLQDLLRAKPNAFNAIVLLSDVEVRLQNFAEAEALLRQISDILPANDEFKKRLAQVAAIRRGEVGEGLDDVTKAIAEVDKLGKTLQGQPGANKQMIAALKPKAEALKWDERIVFALINFQVRDGDREGALEAIRKGLEVKPDSMLLKNAKLSLEAKSPMEGELAVVDAGSAAPVDKRLARADIFVRNQKLDEARKEIEEAFKLNPDDPRVIEQRFMDLLVQEKFDEAEKIEQKAKQLDLDQTGDAITFRARRLGAQKKLPEAIALMKAWTDKGGAQPESWRLLGRMQRLTGNHREAVRAFREAVKVRPNDPAGVTDLVQSLIANGQEDDALKTARDYEKFARIDPDFVNLYLQLEARSGDKTLALQRREEIANITPNDRRNLSALASLYIMTGDPDKATPIVQKMTAAQQDLESVSLDASVKWAKNDAPGAKAVFEEWIKAHDELQSYMAFANFLIRKRDVDSGLTVLDRARTKQNPKDMEIDKATIDVLSQMGRWSDLVPVAKRIVAAGGDTPEKYYQKRLVEAMVRSNALDEADKELAPMLSAATPDMSAMLLKSDVAGARKDAKAQRAALDAAVAKFPQAPLVFVKRGEFLVQDPKTAKDALADFEQAAKLDPQMFEAVRGRAAANASLGNMDKAITDIQAALRLRPNDTDLLISFVGDLLNMNREATALQVADESLKERPRDVETKMMVGEILLRRGGSRANAAAYFRQAFDVDKQEIAAQRFLDTVLDDTPPRTQEADKILTELGARVQKSPGLMMALAKTRSAQNKKGESADAIIQTFNMLNPAEPGPMLAWMADLAKMVPNPSEQDQFLAGAAPRVKSPDWFTFFRASLKIDDPKVKDKAPWVSALRDLGGRNNNPQLRLLAFKGVGRAYYNAGKYAEASQAWQECLKVFPDDLEVMNNLAFTVAKDLKKPEDALPLAKKAAGLRPNSGEVVDTLAYVLLAMKKYDEAIAVSERGVSIASSVDQALGFGIRIAEAKIALGDAAAAKNVLDQTEAVIAQQKPGEVSEERKADLARVRALLPTK